MLDTVFDYITTYSVLITLLALFVSIWALRTAIKSLNLKCGNKIIGYYNICSDTDSSTPYIYEILLQNLKDKEVAIQNIYIRFGKNIYLDMLCKDVYDSYVNIIPPFGTLLLRFGPAYRYVNGHDTVDIRHLITQRNKGQIILSTYRGKVKVGRIKKGWSPTGDYFKNYGTQHIEPLKFYTQESVYGNGKLKNKAIDYSSYGDQVKYIVRLQEGDKKIEYKIFAHNQHQVNKFKNLKFTESNLKTDESLRAFLLNERKDGRIAFDDIIEIINFGDFIEEDRKEAMQYGKPYIPKEENWFEYYVQDKFITVGHNIKEDYKNFRQNNSKRNYSIVVFKWLLQIKNKFGNLKTRTK